MALFFQFIEFVDSIITLAQRPIVAAPITLPLVTLHHRLASTVWTANRLRSRCIMASGVSVARSNTNNDHNQDYDSENNESKHNNFHPLSVRYSARFSRSSRVLRFISRPKVTPFLDMILHLFSSHINCTADICLLS